MLYSVCPLAFTERNRNKEKEKKVRNNLVDRRNIFKNLCTITKKKFSLRFRNRLISTGLEPVLSMYIV